MSSILDFKINGLSALDKAALEGNGGSVKKDLTPKGPPSTHNDPGVLDLIMALTPPALMVLAVIFARKKSGARRTISIKKVTVDSEIEVIFDESVYSAEAPKAEVIKAIAAGLNISVPELTKALDDAEKE